MVKEKIDIKAGRLFPYHFLILAAVFCFAGLLLVVDHPIIGAVLLVLAAFIITAYEGTEINVATRTVREYYCFFMLLKTGQWKRFGQIEGITIRRAKVSQKMFTPRTMNSSTFTHVEYHAYLELAAEKIFLMSDKNKIRLLDKSRSIAQALNTSVVDHAMHR
jgi:hypothetical protein